MKSAYLLAILAVVIAIAGLGYWGISGMSAADTNTGNSSCSYSQVNYYFRESCHYCQDVARDRSLEKLERLGVKVNKYEVVNWGMYGIYRTPTFEFGGQRVEGYRTFEELKQLLNCNA
jgi:hypothetical protein